MIQYIYLIDIEFDPASLGSAKNEPLNDYLYQYY